MTPCRSLSGIQPKVGPWSLCCLRGKDLDLAAAPWGWLEGSLQGSRGTACLFFFPHCLSAPCSSPCPLSGLQAPALGTEMLHLLFWGWGWSSVMSGVKRWLSTSSALKLSHFVINLNFGQLIRGQPCISSFRGKRNASLICKNKK